MMGRYTDVYPVYALIGFLLAITTAFVVLAILAIAAWGVF